jgi:hypothetical protein
MDVAYSCGSIKKAIVARCLFNNCNGMETSSVNVCLCRMFNLVPKQNKDGAFVFINHLFRLALDIVLELGVEPIGNSTGNGSHQSNMRFPCTVPASWWYP